MNAKTADESDDQGEIVGELRPVADMLPPPEQLVPRDDTVKVTLALSRRSVDFFKREAAKQKVPYQRDPGLGRRVHATHGVSWIASQRALRVVRKWQRGDVFPSAKWFKEPRGAKFLSDHLDSSRKNSSSLSIIVRM